MTTLLRIRGLTKSQATQTYGFAARGFRIPVTGVAELTTAFAGTNNDIRFIAKAGGTGGNSITVAFVVAGANTPLSIGVAGNAITVNVATNGSSVATSTAAQVVTAVNGNGSAAALVTAYNAPGNDGTGVVAAQAATPLAGGAAAVEKMVLPGTEAVVDIDDHLTVKRLRRHRAQFIEVLDPSVTTNVIRGLTQSVAANEASIRPRGVRVADNQSPADSYDKAHWSLTNSSTPVTIDTSKEMGRRKALENSGYEGEYFGNVVAAASGTETRITIRCIDQSPTQASGSFIKRGFRIKTGGTEPVFGTPTYTVVAPGSTVQVDLADAQVRRTLRRNKGRFVVISAP